MSLLPGKVRITGGGDGIGHGVAVRFLNAGFAVIITGRRQANLDAVAAETPGLIAYRSDVGSPGNREALAERLADQHADLTCVINNAGIQRRVSLAEDQAPWTERQQEIDILLAGPIHLNSPLIPLLLAHGRPSAIVNVTSGGAYVTQPFAPTYSACKAALHNYTVNLRFRQPARNVADMLEYRTAWSARRFPAAGAIDVLSRTIKDMIIMRPNTQR